jgi:prevent-host-death family protein
MRANIHEAKTHFSQLIARVLAGEEVVICKAGKPVVRLAPIKQKKAARRFGLDRGRFTVPDDFDAPLPADVLAGFEG